MNNPLTLLAVVHTEVCCSHRGCAAVVTLRGIPMILDGAGALAVDRRAIGRSIVEQGWSVGTMQPGVLHRPGDIDRPRQPFPVAFCPEHEPPR